MRLTFRLSSSADPDLIAAMEQIPKRDRSRIIREALRAFFYPTDTNTPERSPGAPRIHLDLSAADLKEGDQDPNEKLDDLLSNF